MAAKVWLDRSALQQCQPGLDTDHNRRKDQQPLLPPLCGIRSERMEVRILHLVLLLLLAGLASCRDVQGALAFISSSLLEEVVDPDQAIGIN